MKQLNCAGKIVDLSRPQVMGVLNLTPDSFSDGGRWFGLDAAIAQAELMVEQGAAIIDVGGESTRPGAPEVSAAEELARVLPVISALAGRISVPISIDTSKAEVMYEAVKAGATMINDVAALSGDGALQAAAEANVPVCLMHMRGTPRTMQTDPVYSNVVAEVAEWLRAKAKQAELAGIASSNIVLDPGFGFGKTLEHNYQLLAALEHLQCAYPLLVGMSRKSMLGNILNKPVEQRLHGGLAAATIAVMKGASIIRTHDVEATADAIKICQAAMAAA